MRARRSSSFSISAAPTPISPIARCRRSWSGRGRGSPQACLLGGLFKPTDNQSPMVAFAGVKGKVEYEMLEVRRFIARHGLRVPHEPAFSGQHADADARVGRRAGGRLGCRLPRDGSQGMWEEGLKLDDKEVLARRIDSAGLDAARLLDGRSAIPSSRNLPKHRRRRRPRRLRHADLFRRRRNVLRQGPAGAGRRGGRGDHGARGLVTA